MIKPRRRRLPAGFWPIPAGDRKTLMTPIGLSLIAAAFAALVMPQQSPFPYRYEKGQIWNYSALKAPFDFEVLYPEEQMRDQLERINSEHAPYYVLHSDIARRQKQRFAELVDEQARISRNDTRFEDLVQNKAIYLSYGQQMLNELFSRGIGGPELEALRRDDPGAAVILVNGNGEQRTPAAEFFTLETALGFLTDTLPYSPLRQPELLLPVFEKTLVPNVLFSDSLTTAGKRRKIAAVISTGITVRKNEVIVKNGDLISEEIYRKLDSLQGRYDTPKGWRVAVGYFILAFAGFLMFFLWLKKEHPALWKRRESLLFTPALVLLLLLLLNLSGWISPGVALLIPIWGLPRLFGRAVREDVGWIAWSLLMVLSTVSLDWSAGWLAIQMAGLAGVQFFQTQTNSWSARAGTTFWVALLQVTVWQACILAGKMPPGLHLLDVILFLALANGLFLLVLPLSRALERALKE